jgi:hypothetical protein
MDVVCTHHGYALLYLPPVWRDGLMIYWSEIYSKIRHQPTACMRKIGYAYEVAVEELEHSEEVHGDEILRNGSVGRRKCGNMIHQVRLKSRNRILQTAINLRIQYKENKQKKGFFWVVTPCCYCKNRRFGET